MIDYLILGDIGARLMESAGWIFGPGIASRAERRTMLARGTAEDAMLRRRLEELSAQRQHREAELVARRNALNNELAVRRRAGEVQVQQQLQIVRERNMDARYPLGHPGTLRELLKPGIVPHLLVSPCRIAGSEQDAHSISRLARAMLDTVDDSGRFIRTISGAFATDAGEPRAIDGNIGAATIANTEFDPQPSIVVYFEESGDRRQARARVSNFFGTTEGEDYVDTTVARLVDQKLEIAVFQDPTTPGPAVEWVELGSEQVEPHEALATAVALFATSVSAVYWRLQGVRWTFGGAAQSPLREVIRAPLEAARALPVGLGQRVDRLNLDLAELAERAVDVDVEMINDPDSAVLVLAKQPDRTVAFFIPESYPTIPPEMFVREETGNVRPIRIDSARWEPSHSLTELLDAL